MDSKAPNVCNIYTDVYENSSAKDHGPKKSKVTEKYSITGNFLYQELLHAKCTTKFFCLIVPSGIIGLEG